MNKQQLIKPMKFGLLSRKLSIVNYQLSILLVFFLAVACGNSRRPGLSDQELFAQQEMADTLLQQSDAGTYSVPSDVQYTESRAIDPDRPPAIIDIETALHQGAEDIPLSNIWTTVNYIKTAIPKDMRILDYVIRDDTLFVSGRTQDKNRLCIVPYTLDGKFLNIIWEVAPDGITRTYHPDIEEEPMPVITAQEPTGGTRVPPPPPAESSWSIGEEVININQLDFDPTGKDIHYRSSRWQDYEHPEYRKYIVSGLNGERKAVRFRRFSDAPHNTYYLPSAGWFHVYETLDEGFKKSPWSLITFSFDGDTLCRFANYNPVTPVNVTAGNGKDGLTAYFYDDRLTFRTDYGDTIFRVEFPDRILPVYAINCGKYKLFAAEGIRNQIENKVYIENIMETQRFLFISINAPTREEQVLLFDKQMQTLRKHRKESFSNDIDNGPAFYPEKIMPDGKTMACRYQSDYFQNNPLEMINSLFPSMGKNSVVFMLVQ